MSSDVVCARSEGHWNCYNPVRIVFGAGALANLPAYVRGRRVLLLTTKGFTRRKQVAPIADLLSGQLVETIDTVEPNPELSDLEDKARMVSVDEIDVIVALGGGSVIDSAKVLGVAVAKARDGFSLSDHLRSGPAGEPIRDGIPVIALPTTAGTGSEVTPFATVWDKDARKKHSLSGPGLYPEVSLLDPLLTLSLPLETTVITGLDAVSQAFESIWNRHATPISTLYATEALRIAMTLLPSAASNLGNVNWRAAMLQASLLSGLAISQTRTALAHSMSYPLTSYYGMPHGLACSFTLPAILRFNSKVDDGRLVRLSRSLGSEDTTSLADKLRQLLVNLGVPMLLRKYVGSLADLHPLVGSMITPSRADNNLRTATIEDVKEILTEAWTDLITDTSWRRRS